ncbi:MAG: hypothetical protein U0350_19380 [Caldilineaceae bacterium]
MSRPTTRRSSSELPQLNETWHVATHHLRVWITPPDAEPSRPWVVLLLNFTTGLMQALELTPEQPTPLVLQEILLKTMRKREPKLQIKPHRPTLLQVEDANTVLALTPALTPLGIRVQHVDRPAQVNQIIADLETHMQGRPPLPGLLAGKGVTPALAGGIFAAAAELYRAAPWTYLTDQHPLAVDVPSLKRKRYVIVMGAGGVEYGLAVYDTWKDVERMYAPVDNPLEQIPAKGAHALHFNTIIEMPFDDLEAMEQYGWEIANKEAYPMPLIFTRQQEVRRPSAKDLQWYEAALRAIPRFVQEALHPDAQGDFAPAEAVISVPTSSGVRDVHITYPAGVLPAKEQRPANMDDWPALDDEAQALPPFDRRAMEGDLAHLIPSRAHSPLDRAQDLMYQAWEERNPARRIILAHEALALSPDCADAYVLLAEEEADTVGRALAYYEQGIAAGERALGKAYFRKNVGHFWGLLETRPYMRARQGLANTLWQVGRKAEARQHYGELLRLNPGDNQGIRYSLLNLLLDMDEDATARQLLAEYDDGMAEWLYTAALIAFRAQGVGPETDALLREALKMNPHVPAYLTGRKKIPVHLPPYIGFGDENEAVSYATSYLKHWRRTPGAVEWLKRVAKL